MNRWLLDTNVIAELVKAEPHPAVWRWMRAQPKATGWISVLTLAELAQGIEKLRPEDGRRSLFEDQLSRIRDRFQDRIVSVDRMVALRFGRLSGALMRAGRLPPIIDTLLAATAIEHGMVLVTRNVKDVAPTGVRVLDPWNAEQPEPPCP